MISASLPENEAARLRSLHELEILDTVEEQAYDDLTAIAAYIAGTPIALVSLIDRDRQWFKSHHGLSARETPRDVAFCAHAILSDEPLVVEDARTDRRFHDNPLTIAAPDVIFYAGIPLSLDKDSRLGTLCVIDHQPHSLSPEQLNLLRALARQVETQLRLRKQLKEMQDFDQARTEFVAMVSHELRSPLTSVCGSLALVASEKLAPLAPENAQLVNVANRNADLLLRLVNDILDLTKMETGHLVLDLKPLVASALASRAQELASGMTARFGCQLQMEGEPDAMQAIVLGDEHRLQQVLSNLLSNAMKHAPTGGIVTLSIRLDEHGVRFCVINQGPGIPLAKQPLLFRKFQQIEARGNERQPGTGLGLVISKQLVELHGGKIGFSSEPDRETCFYFVLAPHQPHHAQAHDSKNT